MYTYIERERQRDRETETEIERQRTTKTYDWRKNQNPLTIKLVICYTYICLHILHKLLYLYSLLIHQIDRCTPFTIYIHIYIYTWELSKLCKLWNIYAPKASTSPLGFTFNNFFFINSIHAYFYQIRVSYKLFRVN